MQFSGPIWPTNGLEPPTLGLAPPFGKFWILHSFLLRLLILQQWYNPHHWVFDVFWFGEAIICLECVIMSIEEESKLSHIALLCFMYRASSSYFFLFFPIFLSILLFFLFFSNFLLFFLFFSHFTYNKQIFVRDLNIVSLFKYVVYRVY